MINLRVVTPPAVEPVSLETVKQYLRVDGTDEDALIASLIKSARETGEELARRAFITQTLELILDAFPTDLQLEVWRPPLQSVTSVKYYDTNNIEATWTDYTVNARSEPGRIHFNSLPGVSLLESGGVVVRYVAGYGNSETSVPERLKQAILALVGHWYENRETVNVGNIVNELPINAKQVFVSERVRWF